MKKEYEKVEIEILYFDKSIETNNISDTDPTKADLIVDRFW